MENQGGNCGSPAAWKARCCWSRSGTPAPAFHPSCRTASSSRFFTTKAPGHGLGLGLDNAMRIVRKHRGHISVRSDPGSTCFRVRLPLDQLQAY